MGRGWRDRYLTVVDNVADLLRSTTSEADSVRDCSYSTSSQAGDEATVTPERWETSVNTKEHLIGEQIKVLEGAVEK